jgi:hypothetical protein
MTDRWTTTVQAAAHVARSDDRDPVDGPDRGELQQDERDQQAFMADFRRRGYSPAQLAAIAAGDDPADLEVEGRAA